MISLIALAVVLIVSSADAGVTYIRWGRTVCPAGASRLYKGYMAASHYLQGGNGGNYLCVHESPTHVRPVAGIQQGSSMIYGVELEYFGEYATANGPFLTDNLNGGKLHDQDLVCALCYVSGSTDQIMVPGRHDCGDVGYDLQYKGFMVAEANTARPRGQFVCLDEAPEGRPGGSADMNQAVVYPVQVGCGSMPCAPYVDGNELSCSVCTY